MIKKKEGGGGGGRGEKKMKEVSFVLHNYARGLIPRIKNSLLPRQKIEISFTWVTVSFWIRLLSKLPLVLKYILTR